ncbi:MFS general substrate transporter [Amniculicola lignicola CBS 123094]|uniref:MFS general substrate transporter n=1 Tax=Amniculicola lignicola CBS 123094 TaxID=1392246 RepID=A0A6A5WC66_9PLEO|nr:MFS general substrate transporter [Amniculicola lignicola CBS 123094]
MMNPSINPRASIEEEEGAPLLSPTRTDSPFLTPEAPSKKSKPWIILCVLIFLLVAIVDFGEFMAQAPKTRVFEANLCLRHYQEYDPSKIRPDGTVEETLCKLDPIQNKLASIFGWQDTFDAIPGILLAIPFGTLADKYGRKWIFALGLFGLQCQSAWVLFICWYRTLPLQMTWMGSLFYLLGGGPSVAVAIGLTMVADIVPPHLRTSVFLYLTSSMLVSEMIAPVIAARLMERSDWYPLVLALIIQGIGISIAVVFPETLHLRDLPEPSDDESEVIELSPKPHGNGIKAQMRHFTDTLKFIRSDYTLGLILFTFLANRLGRQALSLLIRYASKRYNWPIKKAAYLLSFRAATNLVAMTVFVPGVNIFLLKFVRLPAHRADIWLARGSIMITVLAFFIIGAATYPAILIFGLLIYNMGTGYNAAMRSVSIHAVGGQASPDVGRLFAVVAIIESIGAMIAGPGINGLFQWGMDRGEPWIGAPFIAAAVMFVIVTCVTFIINVQDKTVIMYEEVSDEEPSSPVGTTITLERRISLE